MASKTIQVCDWCEDDEAVVRIVKGEGKGEILCENCEDEFKDQLSDEYLEDIEESD